MKFCSLGDSISEIMKTQEKHEINTSLACFPRVLSEVREHRNVEIIQSADVKQRTERMISN